MFTTKLVKASDIKVPEEYKYPNEHKIKFKYDTYLKTGRIDPVLVKNDLTIKDGYITYIILSKYLNHEYIPVLSTYSYKNSPTLYVFGKHPDCDKEFVWRATTNLIDYTDINPGDKAVVSTSHGKQVITVTRTEVLDKPPVNTRVKKVISILRGDNHE